MGGASSYYWERQHGNIPSRSIGINTSNLTLINLQLKDIGSYRCVGINGSGSAASEYATLTYEGKNINYVCIGILHNHRVSTTSLKYCRARSMMITYHEFQ